MVIKTMSRIDEKAKLTEQENAALKQVHEAWKAQHPEDPHRFLSLTKDDSTAKLILKQRMSKHDAKLDTLDEMKARAKQKDRYEGQEDWAWPSNPLEKPVSGASQWAALEQFVSLSDGGLQVFRDHFSKFLPSWFYDLPCVTGGLMAWQAWRTLLNTAWRSGFHPEYVAQLVNIPTAPFESPRFAFQPVCDAQRVVLAIALESWRARFCPKCGKPFVARKPADKYCSETCFSDLRREKQRASKRYRTHKRTKLQRRKHHGVSQG